MTTFRKILLSFLLFAVPMTAQAQSGTPEQQAACRPDVRRYCHHVPQDAGDNAFLKCLQAHRAKLSPRCRDVLESNGQ